MKLLTRTAFVFLTTLALVSAAHAGNRSDTDVAYPVTGGNIYFDKETGTVTACDKGVTNAVIPAEIDGAPVVCIGKKAFQQAIALESVKMSDSVETISKLAFSGRSSLKSVEFSQNLWYIGSLAFLGCENLTELNLPDHLIYIGHQAFAGKMTSVTIPASLSFIGLYVFAGCPKLENINVDSGNPYYSSADGIMYDKT